jgi:hypothetical protein
MGWREENYSKVGEPEFFTGDVFSLRLPWGFLASCKIRVFIYRRKVRTPNCQGLKGITQKFSWVNF